MINSQIIIVAVVSVSFFLAGAGYILFSSPPQPELPQPSVTPTEQPAPPKEAKPSPEQPPLSFEQKVEKVREAIDNVCATGGSREVTLVFTETEANDQAAKLLATAEIPADIPLEVESVYIDFQSDNNVLVEVKSVIYDGPKVTIKVTTHISVEEGKPKVDITKVSFGFLPLPKPLKDRITGLITQEIDDLLNQMTEAGIGCNGKVDFKFKDISIQGEKSTITVVIERRA
ncbi:MAG: hypothetical protein V3S84_03260 [Dehalococcoidales bacterium]